MHWRRIKDTLWHPGRSHSINLDYLGGSIIICWLHFNWIERSSITLGIHADYFNSEESIARLPNRCWTESNPLQMMSKLQTATSLWIRTSSMSRLKRYTFTIILNLPASFPKSRYLFITMRRYSFRLSWSLMAWCHSASIKQTQSYRISSTIRSLIR